MLLGLTAWTMWGFFPLYWPLLEPSGAVEILAHAPIGIFRQVEQPTYDDLAREQIETASQGTGDRSSALAGLLGSGDTWTVV